MSDSVGKISLDLEVQSDISRQVSVVSNAIANNLKESLSGNVKKMFENVNANTKKSMKNITNNIHSSMKKSMTNIAKTMKKILGNIKVPKVEIPRPEMKTANVSEKIGRNKTTRGPPEEVDKETLLDRLEFDRDGKTQEMELIGRQLDNLENKLKLLNQEFDNTFDKKKKNALESQILSTEYRMTSLVDKSRRLELEKEKLQNKIDKLSKSIKEEEEAIKKTSKSMERFHKKMKVFKESVSSAKKQLSPLSGQLSKVSSLFKRKSSSVQNATKNTKSYNSGLSGTVGQMLKWMIIMPMVVKGLEAMATGVLNNLMTNQQFSNSLAQIKSNLMIAFTPIYEAILPAINTLMSALSVATQYIASFISAIFGKTYEQSKQATQSLIDAKTAMGVYGDSAKKAGEAAKDALGLASFDEINTLNSQSNDTSSGNADVSSGDTSIPQLVTPALDTSSVDNAMKGLVDRIKAYLSTFNFEPLINSFNKVKTSVEPIINNLGKIIKWFLVEILDPLAHWAISDLLPAFLNLVAGALDFLNPILEVFMSLGKWLWDSFLQPIATWTGGVIVDVLNGLADVLSGIGNWISEHKTLVEDLVIVIGSFAIAWGLVNVAMGIWNGLVTIWSSIGAIASVVTSGFGAAVAFLTSPIGIAILIIGALIAIGVLLYKHWDEVKAKAIEVWDSIKNKFESFKNWLGNVFATDWSEKFGFFGDRLNSFLANVKNIFDSVKQIFSGIIDFVTGVFTGNWEKAWQGIVDIFKGIVSGLGALIKAPINDVIGLINGAIGGLNSLNIDLPGGKKIGFNIPKIPYLAKGGIIDSPTLAMIGEQGSEVVVPLENNTQGLDLLASKLMERMGGSQQNEKSTSSDRPIEITLQISSTRMGKIVIDSLNKLQQQQGIIKL